MEITIYSVAFSAKEDENLCFFYIYLIPDYKLLYTRGFELIMSFDLVISDPDIFQLLVFYRR